jgi:oligopeptide/dipeptide ABC transporter ATP-binding protein
MGAQKREILLEVNDLKKYYPLRRKPKTKSLIHAVDGVSFSIKKGKTLGLVGESGCGKSTVGKMIARLIPASSGSVLFKNQNILTMNQKEFSKIRRQIQYIFQDPFTSLNPRMRINRILQEPIKLYHLAAGAALKKRILSLLNVVGIPKDFATRYPHELSGGQRQRIGIARALSLNPGLIICDEPVSALDVSIRIQILNLLEDLQQEYGITYLFIAHGMDAIKYISDDVVVMYMGKIVEYAPVDELFARPYHPYTQALISAIPVPDPDIPFGQKLLKGEVPQAIMNRQGCIFANRCPFAREDCFQQEPEYREISHGRFVACHYA